MTRSGASSAGLKVSLSELAIKLTVIALVQKVVIRGTIRFAADGPVRRSHSGMAGILWPYG